MDNKALKPMASRVSQWNSQREIIYHCPVCSTSFAILGRQEQFCHGCGQKLDWSVIVKGNQKLASLYFNSSECIPGECYESRKLIAEINYINHYKVPMDNTPRELDDIYEFQENTKQLNEDNRNVFGQFFALSKDDEIPFNCMDCMNSKCRWSGCKACAFCEHFSAT